MLDNIWTLKKVTVANDQNKIVYVYVEVLKLLKIQLKYIIKNVNVKIKAFLKYE